MAASGARPQALWCGMSPVEFVSCVTAGCTCSQRARLALASGCIASCDLWGSVISCYIAVQSILWEWRWGQTQVLGSSCLSYVLCSLLPKEGFPGFKPRAGNTGRWGYLLSKGRIRSIKPPRAQRIQAWHQETASGSDREEGKQVAFMACGERGRWLLRVRPAKSVAWTREFIFREDSAAFQPW